MPVVGHRIETPSTFSIVPKFCVLLFARVTVQIVFSKREEYE
jgi:hypothetical protein